MLGVVLYCSLPYILKQNLSLNVESTDWLDYLANPRNPPTPPTPLILPHVHNADYMSLYFDHKYSLDF